MIHSNISDHRKSWLEEDITNYKSCPNIWNEVRDMYYVILLDGGEFSTFSEFMKLKDRTTILLLDDTREIKNSDVVIYLNNSNDWKNLVSSTERNGYAVYERLYTD